jgi:Domain of unknown function (DUF1906)
MRARGHGIRPVLALVVLLALLSPASSLARRHPTDAWKRVTYRGYSVRVPRSWPVYDLSRDPHVCVRFNRRAVYLGTPGSTEHCPGHAAGRPQAILLEPAGASAARIANPAAVRPLRHPALPAVGPHLAAHASHPGAHTAQAVYTGPGFDACSAPSPRAMSAWGSSPYRALGIYIGGANAACAQPNLSSTWIVDESAAGWHMMPTYVGLQAPNNSCGCAAITPSQASAQGTAAAQDAVNDAQTLGLGPGTPIYDDMEYYSRTQANTSAVLAFLASWTSQLHADGYLSGVYGNSNSAITDLVSQYGTSYPEPDDVWMANWNGQQTTNDAAVPSSDWASHQRLHQYRGGHNETYGGVTINIDNDYVDAATATSDASSAPATPPPTLTVSPAASGTTNLAAGWGGAGLLSWRALGGTDPASMVTVGSASARGANTHFGVRSSAPFFAVQALGSSGQVLATSAPVTAPSHLLLFGRSVFVGAGGGVGGIPVGCYLPTTCHVTTTVSSGHLTLAHTGTEAVPSGGGGLVFFKLTRSALRTLDRTRTRRLPVQVTVKDVTGRTATAKFNLIPFSTRGRAPTHSLTPDPVVRPVGVSDFVYARGPGGILAGCNAASACRISATLTVGRTTIASTHPELVGGRELGYVLFSLTSKGRQMLTHAAGNQLGANLTLRSGADLARARITLIQFS